MVKRMIILGILSSLLLVLLFFRSHISAPVNQTNSQNNDSSEYTTLEYKINKIEDNQYYGKSEEGKEIIFSANSISKGDKIQVDDEVICYFEKGNLGKGIIKVEKKET